MHQSAMPIGGYHAKSFLHRVSPPSSTRSNRRLGAACHACRPASFGGITLETSALPPRAPPFFRKQSITAVCQQDAPSRHGNSVPAVVPRDLSCSILVLL